MGHDERSHLPACIVGDANDAEADAASRGGSGTADSIAIVKVAALGLAGELDN